MAYCGRLSGMPGSFSYDKLAYFTMAFEWAKRLRNATYPESAANLFVEANRGKAVNVTALTARLARKGVPRCNAACQLSEVCWAASRQGSQKPSGALSFFVSLTFSPAPNCLQVGPGLLPGGNVLVHMEPRAANGVMRTDACARPCSSGSARAGMRLAL